MLAEPMLFSVNMLGFNKQKSPKRCLWTEGSTENMKEMEILGGKKISLKHHERMLCLGLDPIETCESSIPELLGEMLCFMGSTNQE